MAGELNTEVLDDPASCRTAADWLGRVKPGVAHVGDAVYGKRGASEDFWQGTAGEAARGALTDLGKDADTLEELVQQVKTALDAFAGKIDTVNQRMRQARSVAREGKLIVTPTAILPPEPAPAGGDTGNFPGPVGHGAAAHRGQQPGQSDAAMAAHDAKKRAFREAQTTVQDARSKQDEAHKALDDAMKDPLAAAKTTKTYSTMVVSGGLSSIKGATRKPADSSRRPVDGTPLPPRCRPGPRRNPETSAGSARTPPLKARSSRTKRARKLPMPASFTVLSGSEAEMSLLVIPLAGSPAARKQPKSGRRRCAESRSWALLSP